jgi:hypothetical protein
METLENYPSGIITGISKAVPKQIFIKKASNAAYKNPNNYVSLLNKLL